MGICSSENITLEAVTLKEKKKGGIKEKEGGQAINQTDNGGIQGR